MKNYISIIAALLFATTVSANNNAAVDSISVVSDSTENAMSQVEAPYYQSETSTQEQPSNSSNKKWKKNFFKVCLMGGSLHMETDVNIFNCGKDMNNLKYICDKGFGIATGHTYYIGNGDKKYRFGVEATWFDFNYAHYKLDDARDVTYGKMDFSSGVGGSLTYQPVNGLYVKPYVQVYLTITGMAGDEYDSDQRNFTRTWSSFHFGFEAMGVCGVNVAYKFFGLGIEGHYGSFSATDALFLGGASGSHTDWRAYATVCF